MRLFNSTKDSQKESQITKKLELTFENLKEAVELYWSRGHPGQKVEITGKHTDIQISYVDQIITFPINENINP